MLLKDIVRKLSTSSAKIEGGFQNKIVNQDEDGDGLNTLKEQIWKTNPYSNDTDGDGIDDGKEVEQGSDPLDACDDQKRTNLVDIKLTSDS